MDSWMFLLGSIATLMALGVFFLTFGSWTTSRPMKFERRILKYSDGAKALVILCGALLPTAILYFYSTSRLDLNVALLALLLDALFVGYCGPEFFRTRIEFDAERVYAFSAWRKPRIIPWTVIMTCKYSISKRWNTFDTFGYGSLRVSDFLVGTDEFTRQFEEYGQELTDYRQARSHG